MGGDGDGGGVNILGWRGNEQKKVLLKRVSRMGGHRLVLDADLCIDHLMFCQNALDKMPRLG